MPPSPISMSVSKLAALLFTATLILPLAPKPALACACCDTYRVVDVEDWDVLNVRSGPSTRYRIVGALPPGTCGLQILKDRGGWIKIQSAGIRGWVNARYVAFR